MGVDILSRQVTLSGCVPADSETTAINRNSVKRSLFGPVDHQEAMSFFHKEFAKMESEKMKEWNFDFINEKPLKGNFKWEKVQPTTQVISKMTYKVTKLKASRKCPLRSLKRSHRDCVNSDSRQTTITGKLSFINMKRLRVKISPS